MRRSLAASAGICSIAATLPVIGRLTLAAPPTYRTRAWIIRGPLHGARSRSPAPRGDGLRRGDRRRGPCRPFRRHQAQAARRRGRPRAVAWSCWRRAPRSGRTSCRAPSSIPSASTALIPDWKAKGAPVETAVSEDRFYYLGPRRQPAHPQFRHAAADGQPRQLHRQPRQPLPLAGRAGDRAGRRDLSGLCRRRGALRRQGRGDRRRHGRHGGRQERRADRPLHPRHGAQGQVHHHRRGRARLAHQAADRQVRPRAGPPAAEIRPRPQGAVGGAPRDAPAGARPAHARLAARQPHRRRLVPLSLRQQPGVGRLRRAPQLRQSAPVALRRVPALQDPSRHPRHLRGRQAHRLRGPRAERGRLAVDPEARPSPAACSSAVPRAS